MKKLSCKILIVGLFLLICFGCSQNRENSIKPNESIQNEPSTNVSDGEGNDNNNEGNGIVIDEDDNQEDVIYEEPYAIVTELGWPMKWCVLDGELTEMKYEEYYGHIYPQEKYSEFSVEWSYINGKLYLGRELKWYTSEKIPNSEDKILLSYKMPGLDEDGPYYRVFDLSTKEILNIYPEYLDYEYVMTGIAFSLDCSDVVFMCDTEIYHYNGTEVTKVEAFKEKLAPLSLPRMMMEDEKILVLGLDFETHEICRYVYDLTTEELIEQRYPTASSGSSAWLYRKDIRYGTSYEGEYMELVDFLTGRKDRTDIPTEEVHHTININEECFLVLADYGYLIEKVNGRLVAKTEHELLLSDEDAQCTIDIVPSDEDLYFYMQYEDSEEILIYKIEVDAIQP